VQSPARPASKPVVRAKPTAKKKKRPARNVPTAGAVAGTTATLPPATETELPSDLAAPAIETPSTEDGGAPISILLTSLIGLALVLAALASIPTRQLAVLPATRWIVKRRLDLVIGGMGALAALLGVLFISAVFGP
jgi:hypothetical protein